MVAHEPPVVGILPDAERQRAMFTDVYDTYRTHGLQAAAARITAGLEERPATPLEPGTEPQPLSPAEELNNPMALFLTRVVRPFTSYAPDLTALSAAPPRLTVGMGVDSTGHLLYRTATFLARRTGSAARQFPAGTSGRSPTRRSSPRGSWRRWFRRRPEADADRIGSRPHRCQRCRRSARTPPPRRTRVTHPAAPGPPGCR